MSVPPVSSATDPRPGRVVFGIAVLVVAGGLAYLGFAPQHWLRGVFVVGAGLAFAGLVRWFLPDPKAGPLYVRGRFFDGLVYIAAGVAVGGFGVMVS